MPASLQSDRLEVVLVSPRNPLNIGAAARAMANFGFERLSVIAPYEPHWREARSAVGAEELLQKARRTKTLQEAIADCTLVLGTGSREYRKPEQNVVLLPDLAPLAGAELLKGGRMALVFGPEKRGLRRDDLSLCHALVEIPTHSRQPSMNLGQAVAVCLYEMSTRLFAALAEPVEVPAAVSVESPARREARPTSAQLERLAEAIERTMAAANYSPAAMRTANAHDLRLLLRRLALSQADACRILGVFRRILWRLQH